MESIFTFDTTIIKAKNGQDYVKILLLTHDQDAKLSAYTAFTKYENGIQSMIMTPDYCDSLKILDLTYVGKVGYDSRYAALLEYANVDGVPQICNIIFNKNY